MPSLPPDQSMAPSSLVTVPESILLLPKKYPKLEQLLTTINITIAELEAAGFSAEKLEHFLSHDWLRETLQTFWNLDRLPSKFLLMLFFHQRDLQLSTTAENPSPNSKKRLRARLVIDYFKTRVWIKAKTIPTYSERMLKQIYAFNAWTEGVNFIIEKAWTVLLLSFLAMDIYTYYNTPTRERTTTLWQVVNLWGNNETNLSTSLDNPIVWPLLSLLPLVWGTLKAWSAARETQITPEEIQTLVTNLNAYQPGLWKDTIKLLISWLIPEMLSSIIILPIPPLFLELLPSTNISSTIEKFEQLLLWDARLTTTQRSSLLQAFQSFARQSAKLTRLQTLLTCSRLAESMHPREIQRLQTAGLADEQLKELLAMIGVAYQEIQHNASWDSLGATRYNWPTLLPQYMYANLLLIRIGKLPKHLKTLYFLPLYLAFQGIQWFAKFQFYRMVIYQTLLLGTLAAVEHYLEKKACEAEGKLWRYFQNRKEWNCTACGNLPIFYRYMFDIQTCLDTYLRHRISNFTELSNNLKVLNLSSLRTLDLSYQELANEELAQILNMIQTNATHLEELYLNVTSNWYAFRPLPLYPAGTQAIANLLLNSTIKILDLAYRSVDLNMSTVIPYALARSQIRQLNWQGGLDEVTVDAVLKALASILNQTHIQELLIGQYSRAGNYSGMLDLANALPSSQLISLDIKSIPLYYSESIALAKALPHSLLQKLHIEIFLQTSNKSAEVTQTWADGLKQAEELKELNLGIIDKNDINYLPILVQGITQSNIINLLIDCLFADHQRLTDETLIALAKGLPSSRIKKLTMVGFNWTQEAATAFAEMLPITALQELILLEYSGYANESAIWASAIPQSNLSSLTVQVTQGWLIDYSSIAMAIVNSLRNSTLTQLYLGVYPYVLGTRSDAGFYNLDYSNKILDDNYINDFVKALGQLLFHSMLESLDIEIYYSSQQYRGDGINILAEGLASAPIKAFSLSSLSLSDEAAITLFKALQRTTLKILELNNVDITAASIGELTKVLVNSSLAELLLPYNHIDDSALSQLAQVLPSSALQMLDLYHNNITDAGAVALAQSLTTAQIPARELWISLLDNQQEQALALAEPRTPLQTLDVRFGNITTQGVIALCRVIPQTYINKFFLVGGVSPPHINYSEVDPRTCTIYTSSASTIAAPWPYHTLYDFYQNTLDYFGVVSTHSISRQEWMQKSLPTPGKNTSSSLFFTQTNQSAQEQSTHLFSTGCLIATINMLILIYMLYRLLESASSYLVQARNQPDYLRNTNKQSSYFSFRGQFFKQPEKSSTPTIAIENNQPNDSTNKLNVSYLKL